MEENAFGREFELESAEEKKTPTKIHLKSQENERGAACSGQRKSENIKISKSKCFASNFAGAAYFFTVLLSKRTSIVHRNTRQHQDHSCCCWPVRFS